MKIDLDKLREAANKQRDELIKDRDAEDRVDQETQEVEQEIRDNEARAQMMGEPSRIAAKAMEMVARAMHRPNRREALLHTNISKNLLSSVIKLEMVEKSAATCLTGQNSELIDLIDNYNDVAEGELKESEKIDTEKKIVEQANLVKKNTLYLKGICESADTAVELAFAAVGGERAKHGLQNIGGLGGFSRQTPDIEGEQSKGYIRKLKEALHMA